MAILLSKQWRLCFKLFIGGCVFFFIIASTVAFDHSLKLDFPELYCRTINECCQDRQDHCSLPIASTRCYCDEFCDRDHSSDCCPDYHSFCKNEPDPIISCFYNGVYFNKYNTTQDNCNKCRCLDGGRVECENDLCLTDNELVHNINKNYLAGWTARKYEQWWGHKYSKGISERLGTMEPTYRVKKMIHLHNQAVVLPKQFNAIEKWPRYISKIQDQGWCSSSWVMSTISVASDRFAIQSQGKEIPNLSPQNILSCTRKQQGCNGGHLDAAWRYLHKQGVMNENCYPYKARVEKCQITQGSRKLSANGCYLTDESGRDEFYTVGPAYSLRNETDIMAEIFHSGPVQATMKVERDFFAYSSGVYRYTAANRNSPAGLHSVKLIGWGEEHDGTKYWIAANSWGTWWGEKGYFRILRGQNECQIEEYILAAWPNVYNHFTTKPSV